MTTEPVPLIRSGRIAQRQRPDQRTDLARVRRGVYADADAWAALPAWDRYRARVEAFRLVNPTAVLSHESAALALGLPTFGEPQRIHVYAKERSKTSTTGDVTRHASLDDRKVVLTDLGPATSPADTALDLGRSHNRAYALSIWDAVLAGGVPLNSLRETWRSQCSSRGTRSLAWLEERAVASSESPGESVSRALISWLGIEEPELQVEILTDDGHYRADFFWRKRRIVGEFDGYAKYGSDGDSWNALKREKRREDSLRRAGFTVVRWEHRDLVDVNRLAKILKSGGLTPTEPQDPALLDAYRRATRGSIR